MSVSKKTIAAFASLCFVRRSIRCPSAEDIITTGRRRLLWSAGAVVSSLALFAVAALWGLGWVGSVRANSVLAQTRSLGDQSRPVDSEPRVPQGALSTLAPQRETSLTATLNYSIHVYFPAFMHVNWSELPDLVITHVSFDSPDVVAGQPLQFSTIVQNRGSEDTAHNVAPDWFSVEVYFKNRAFSPVGAPMNALDHAGGYCSNASPNCISGTEQPERVAFLGNLAPGESREVAYTLVFPSSDLYDIYVQVDTTWPAAGYTGKAWGQHYEENEQNNIFAVEDFFVPPAR